MTQLRRCKCDNSNYFDRVLDGIGHRGSSFSDVDAITHDGKTQRFLLQEFKREGEPRDQAQHWMLRELAFTLKKLPGHFTVWVVERRNDGRFGWAVYGQDMRVITLEEYRARFAAWWENKEYVPAYVPSLAPGAAMLPKHKRVERDLDVDEITWS